MHEKCTEGPAGMRGRGEQRKAGIICRTMDERKAGIRCQRTEERKTAEYRGEQNIRKRRDVDVRNGREMVAGFNRKGRVIQTI